MKRITTAAAILPFLIVSILVSWLQLLFVVIVAAAMALALLEFWKLAKRRGMKPDMAAGYLGAAAIFTVFFFDEPGLYFDGLLVGPNGGVRFLLDEKSIASMVVALGQLGICG